MKNFIFYLLLCFLLLGLKSNACATKHNGYSQYNSIENRQLKFKNNNPNPLIYDDAELDQEEDHFSDVNVKNFSEHSFFLEKYNSLNSYYYTNLSLSILNNHKKLFKTSRPFYQNSSPIYILINVFRI
jgi:hypothetical protein